MEKILIIDDSIIVQAMLENILGSKYELDIHGDPVAGLAAARSSQPDLILLDIHMPEMNGYEVCRLLRQEEGTRGIPVIFLTSLDAEEDRVRGFDAGADDYVVKPFFPQELFSRVKAHLGARTAKKQALEMERLAVFRELAVTVSHEINNPLTAVNAYIHLLQNELLESSPSVKELLAGIHDESRRLGLIVKKIAQASSAATKTYHRDIKMIDLNGTEGKNDGCFS